jgi:hypothetical protein
MQALSDVIDRLENWGGVLRSSFSLDSKMSDLCGSEQAANDAESYELEMMNLS